MLFMAFAGDAYYLHEHILFLE